MATTRRSTGARPTTSTARSAPTASGYRRATRRTPRTAGGGARSCAAMSAGWATATCWGSRIASRARGRPRRALVSSPPCSWAAPRPGVPRARSATTSSASSSIRRSAGSPTITCAKGPLLRCPARSPRERYGDRAGGEVRQVVDLDQDLDIDPTLSLTAMLTLTPSLTSTCCPGSGESSTRIPRTHAGPLFYTSSAAEVGRSGLDALALAHRVPPGVEPLVRCEQLLLGRQLQIEEDRDEVEVGEADGDAGEERVAALDPLELLETQLGARDPGLDDVLVGAIGEQRGEQPLHHDLADDRRVSVIVHDTDDLIHPCALLRILGGQRASGEHLVDVAEDRRGLVDLESVVRECRHRAERIAREMRRLLLLAVEHAHVVQLVRSAFLLESHSHAADIGTELGPVYDGRHAVLLGNGLDVAGRATSRARIRSNLAAARTATGAGMSRAANQGESGRIRAARSARAPGWRRPGCGSC